MKKEPQIRLRINGSFNHDLLRKLFKNDVKLEKIFLIDYFQNDNKLLNVFLIDDAVSAVVIAALTTLDFDKMHIIPYLCLKFQLHSFLLVHMI